VEEQLIQISKVLEELGLIVGNNSDIRYQVINITVPNPTTANTTVQQSATLDRKYNKVIGIGYFEITDGGATDNYNVGAKSSRQQWIDSINIGAWKAPNVGPRFKFFPTNIGYGSGDTFFVEVTPLENTVSAFTGQMVLILKADLTENPR
jgi:hypothetical protein